MNAVLMFSAEFSSSHNIYLKYGKHLCYIWSVYFHQTPNRTSAETKHMPEGGIKKSCLKVNTDFMQSLLCWFTFYKNITLKTVASFF